MTLLNDRSTYFYNIQKNDDYVVDEYRIWYKDYLNTEKLYKYYELNLTEYISKQNHENKMDFCVYEEEIEGNNKKSIKTIMNYKSLEIEYKIEIVNIDGNNLHVTVFLNNLLDVPNYENPFYIEILDICKGIKNSIIEINKYYNEITDEITDERSKEEKDLCKIDKLMERF